MTKEKQTTPKARIITASEETRKTISLFFEEVKWALKNGETVKIRGFGSFKVETQSACLKRNPQTGEKIRVPERKHIKFIESQTFRKNELNKGE